MLDLNAIRDSYMFYDAKEGKLTIRAMESLLRRICQVLDMDADAVDEERLVAQITLWEETAAYAVKQVETARQRIAALGAQLAAIDGELDKQGIEREELVADIEPPNKIPLTTLQRVNIAFSINECEKGQAEQRIAELEVECERLQNDVQKEHSFVLQYLDARNAERQRAQEAEDALGGLAKAAEPLCYVTYDPENARLAWALDKALKHPAVKRLIASPPEDAC